MHVPGGKINFDFRTHFEHLLKIRFSVQIFETYCSRDTSVTLQKMLMDFKNPRIARVAGDVILFQFSASKSTFQKPNQCKNLRLASAYFIRIYRDKRFTLSCLVINFCYLCCFGCYKCCGNGNNCSS